HRRHPAFGVSPGGWWEDWFPMGDDGQKRNRWNGLDMGGGNRQGNGGRSPRWRFSLWWILALVLVLYLLRGLALSPSTEINHSAFLDAGKNRHNVKSATRSD